MIDYILLILGSLGTWASFVLLISVESERWGRILFALFILSLVTVGWAIRGILL